MTGPGTSLLTFVLKGNKLKLLGAHSATARYAERTIVKTKLRAREPRAIAHAHQIHSAGALPASQAQIGSELFRRANGGSVRLGKPAAVAEVFGGRGSAGNESSHAVPRNVVAGSERNGRASLRQVPSCGRDDRAGQRVIAAGLAAQAVDSAAQLESESGLNSANSQSLPATTATGLPESLTLFVRETLRAAALAPTVFDALDITGDALRRIADIARVEVSA